MEGSGKNPFRDRQNPPMPGPPLPEGSEEETVVQPRPGFSQKEEVEVSPLPPPSVPPTPTTPTKPLAVSEEPTYSLDPDPMSPGKMAAIAVGAALATALIAFFLLNALFSPGSGVIENDSVTTSKIVDGAVTDEKIAPDTLITGPTGPEGPTGPRGKIGPTGPAGKSAKAGGLTGVEFVNDVSPTDSALAKSFDLTCPRGKKVIAGGAEIISGNESVALSGSFPTNDGKSWSARAIETEAFPGKWFISINLTCAKVSG